MRESVSQGWMRVRECYAGSMSSKHHRPRRVADGFEAIRLNFCKNSKKPARFDRRSPFAHLGNSRQAIDVIVVALQLEFLASGIR